MKRGESKQELLLPVAITSYDRNDGPLAFRQAVAAITNTETDEVIWSMDMSFDGTVMMYTEKKMYVINPHALADLVLTYEQSEIDVNSIPSSGGIHVTDLTSDQE